jgi:hypothetical protein
MPNWLAQTDTPLFVSRRRIAARANKNPPVALGPWALDSGGFTELNLYGHWKTSIDQYADEILRWSETIGNLDWAAPMDWMCEPGVVAKTGLSVAEHQQRTLANFMQLRSRVGSIVIPVLQGWTVDDYARHVGMYERCGVYLARERIVGIGSICRRGQDAEIQRIVRVIRAATPTIQLHAFGVRSDALLALSDILASADSMAWSAAARLRPPLAGCTHKTCSNCIRYAQRWYDTTTATLGQTRLEVPA